MPMFKYLVYEKIADHLLELIATFRDEKEAKDYCQYKRIDAKRRKCGVEKDYVLKKWEENRC